MSSVTKWHAIERLYLRHSSSPLGASDLQAWQLLDSPYAFSTLSAGELPLHKPKASPLKRSSLVFPSQWEAHFMYATTMNSSTMVVLSFFLFFLFKTFFFPFCFLLPLKKCSPDTTHLLLSLFAVFFHHVLFIVCFSLIDDDARF